MEVKLRLPKGEEEYDGCQETGQGDAKANVGDNIEELHPESTDIPHMKSSKEQEEGGWGGGQKEIDNYRTLPVSIQSLHQLQPH